MFLSLGIPSGPKFPFLSAGNGFNRTLSILGTWVWGNLIPSGKGLMANSANQPLFVILRVEIHKMNSVPTLFFNPVAEKLAHSNPFSRRWRGWNFGKGRNINLLDFMSNRQVTNAFMIRTGKIFMLKDLVVALITSPPKSDFGVNRMTKRGRPRQIADGARRAGRRTPRQRMGQRNIIKGSSRSVRKRKIRGRLMQTRLRHAGNRSSKRRHLREIKPGDRLIRGGRETQADSRRGSASVGAFAFRGPRIRGKRRAGKREVRTTPPP